MAQYDLTHVMGKFLDKHLLLRIIDFLEDKKVYPADNMMESRFKILASTKNMERAQEACKAVKGDVDQDLKKKQEDVAAELLAVRNRAGPILDVMAREGVQNLKDRKHFSLNYLGEHYRVTRESVEALYDYAKLQFDMGMYRDALENLAHYRTLTVGVGSSGVAEDRYFAAQWGRLAAAILSHDWESALDDLTKLKDAIDAKKFDSPAAQLHQRSWLLHWSLFVFFNHPHGRSIMVDILFQDRYLNAVQTSCPHILRYLTTAVIITHTSRRKVVQGSHQNKDRVKDLVKIITMEKFSYRDPITELLECLYVNFDFDAAQQKLRECEQVLKNDYFLSNCIDDFIENARFIIFETYCRIHRSMDISMLAEKLNMERDAAEKWIVNLIRNADLNAKIDSKMNTVVMTSVGSTIHSQIMDRTRSVLYRATALGDQVLQNKLSYRVSGEKA
mmetsp:Transcript_45189/g.116927  ORF Transcript_45189/g.116927 Transcript_45189/m.116927 type:complete len:446 (-) Transcript_45189:287-1624(-)|eukprot:CAMPEP_0113869104 /NCGR_PEP_ID=MMETSP0780_2-20120614/1354_1 /TAXON_ID=652834 /ORGANISM="Palpitomonas bilix" /LENGTH=445 /DNA_ID=CAMNT_0000854251 /DNA_START=180 /DNA_END=1517 /DNA_ORIENTATION=- /assembly_acc=CAM_ASM_000599